MFTVPDLRSERKGFFRAWDSGQPKIHLSPRIEIAWGGGGFTVQCCRACRNIDSCLSLKQDPPLFSHGVPEAFSTYTEHYTLQLKPASLSRIKHTLLKTYVSYGYLLCVESLQTWPRSSLCPNARCTCFYGYDYHLCCLKLGTFVSQASVSCKLMMQSS